MTRRGVHPGVMCVERVRVELDGETPWGRTTEDDYVAIEEPLEIRIAGDRWVVTMRTPGGDRELAAGLLFAEGIITSRDDLASLAHCGRPGDDDYGNVLDVKPAPGGRFAWERIDAAEHHATATSACGVCGRETIDDLLQRRAPLDACSTFEASGLEALQASLAAAQTTFQLTGGVHAASLFREGQAMATFEDVGRHNAVDKVFGKQLLERSEAPGGGVLLVSSRASFEIVQKAVVSRCSAVVSVSAPSSLAIETARAFNLILIGFARAGSFNVYAGEGRVT